MYAQRVIETNTDGDMPMELLLEITGEATEDQLGHYSDNGDPEDAA